MGSYCELYISNYLIATTKNEIDPFLLSIFQPNDLVVYERKIGERYQLLYGRDDSVDERERAIQYINTAQNLKERLNVVGFTMKRVEEAFENSKIESLERLNEWIEDKRFNDNETIEKTLKEEVELLKNSNLSDFLNASKEIIKDGYKIERDDSEISENLIVEYLLYL
jgi:hypothetical protein